MTLSVASRNTSIAGLYVAHDLVAARRVRVVGERIGVDHLHASFIGFSIAARFRPELLHTFLHSRS